MLQLIEYERRTCANRTCELTFLAPIGDPVRICMFCQDDAKEQPKPAAARPPKPEAGPRHRKMKPKGTPLTPKQLYQRAYAHDYYIRNREQILARKKCRYADHIAR